MTAANTPRLRGRKSSRPTADERELAILTTLEHLLGHRHFADISVDDLAKGAGLSRPTFYFYFPSKDAVLLTLFDQVLRTADATLHTTGTTSSDDPIAPWREKIREKIYAFFDSLQHHRAVVLAGLAATTVNTDIARLWSQFMHTWINHTAALITAERIRGVAPKTIDAHHLATSLNLMNERVIYSIFSNETFSNENITAASNEHTTTTPTEDSALETLVYIWVTSIYGNYAISG